MTIRDEIQAILKRYDKDPIADYLAECLVSRIQQSPLITPRTKPTIDDVVLFAKELGLPLTDGEYFYNHWEGNGWKNAGKPIKCWKATIRAWKAAGHCPSQRQPQVKYGTNQTTSAASRRNAGTIQGTDYGAAGKRKLDNQLSRNMESPTSKDDNGSPSNCDVIP